MSSDLIGFLDIGYHGDHRGEKENPSALVAIAEEAADGQFEFSFCSIACLRLYLTCRVGELERRVAREVS